jgi:hypothetical protein
MADPLKGIPHLTDAELKDTWGWVQTTVAANAPVAIAFTAELRRRGLTAPPKPLKFNITDLVDLTTRIRRPSKRNQP